MVNSIEAALEHSSDAEELMIIGGASLYQETLSLARRIYLTQVHADVEGDTWFPEIRVDEWMEAERSSFPADESNNHPYSFIVLERLTALASSLCSHLSVLHVILQVVPDLGGQCWIFGYG